MEAGNATTTTDTRGVVIDMATLNLAQAPPICPGSGEIVPTDSVDGDHVATCPSCRRPRLAIRIEVGPGGWAVEAHNPLTQVRHLARCRDEDGKLECCCGLDDVEARVCGADLSAYLDDGRQSFLVGEPF